MTEVDVIIITWDDPPEMLEAAVASARASLDVTVHVLVLDNGSTLAAVPLDGVAVWKRSNTNLGVAPGRNRAAALGSSRVICFLDSDAALLPEALSRLIVALDDRRVGVVAPVYVGQAPQASGGRRPGWLRKLARGLGVTRLYGATARDGREWDVDFAIGACLVLRRADFERLGGFDASYFYGPEDVELCLRVGDAGLAVRQVGDALCLHPARRRFRWPFSRRGAAHALAIARHLHRRRRVRPS